MSSGSSGLSFASDSARSTVRFRLSSSSTLVVADARRLPIVDVTVTMVSVVPPLVVISLPAKRVLPLQPLVMLTRVSSALANDSTRSASALACSRVRKSGVGGEEGLGISLPSPVFTMFTLRKRAGGQPWLTEFDCDGSPLPSPNAPPSQ